MGEPVQHAAIDSLVADAARVEVRQQHGVQRGGGCGRVGGRHVRGGAGFGHQGCKLMHELLERWSLVGSVVPALLHGGEQLIWAAIFNFAEIGAAFCVAHEVKSGKVTYVRLELYVTYKLGMQSKHQLQFSTDVAQCPRH